MRLTRKAGSGKQVGPPERPFLGTFGNPWERVQGFPGLHCGLCWITSVIEAQRPGETLAPSWGHAVLERPGCVTRLFQSTHYLIQGGAMSTNRAQKGQPGVSLQETPLACRCSWTASDDTLLCTTIPMHDQRHIPLSPEKTKSIHGSMVGWLDGWMVG